MARLAVLVRCAKAKRSARMNRKARRRGRRAIEPSRGARTASWGSHPTLKAYYHASFSVQPAATGSTPLS